jgi:hypothetical protein
MELTSSTLHSSSVIFLINGNLLKLSLLLKHGKPPNDPSFYRPISFLPMLSKVFEKPIFRRLLPIIDMQKILPNHKFGFRQHHSIIQQTHRIVNKINEVLYTKQYCCAAFLDKSQAFDKVWHTGLQYKLRQSPPLMAWKISTIIFFCYW